MIQHLVVVGREEQVLVLLHQHQGEKELEASKQYLAWPVQRVWVQEREVFVWLQERVQMKRQAAVKAKELPIHR